MPQVLTQAEEWGRLLGKSIRRVRQIANGHNTILYLLTLETGVELVAKQSRRSIYGNPTLDVEAWMLHYLASQSSLPVPELLYESPELLIMTHLPSDSRLAGGAEAHAAELLAALHGVAGEHFGLDRDTLIGPLPQSNPQTDSWIEFFARHRLVYMAEQAFHEEKINPPLAGKIEQLAGRLSEWIDEPEHPSLIHGDLWQGNLLACGGKISGFIDPAIYYAHPEIELAFSTMFGTFGEAFFKRYHEIRPIKDGFFDCRREIYNLYPLLVHARLYGGGYVQQIARTVERFVG